MEMIWIIYGLDMDYDNQKDEIHQSIHTLV